MTNGGFASKACADYMLKFSRTLRITNAKMLRTIKLPKAIAINETAPQPTYGAERGLSAAC